MTTAKLIEELDALYAKATPGEWRVRRHSDGTLNILEGDVKDARNGEWAGEWIATFPDLIDEAQPRQQAAADLIIALRAAWPKLRAAVAAREGFVMVPREPTQPMKDAAWLVYGDEENFSAIAIYRAMLAAAPSENEHG